MGALQQIFLANIQSGSVYPTSLKLFIDAGNPASYSGSGTTVTDLIGTQNGTLVNAVGYNSANGGYFTFNGVNQYIDLGNNATVRDLTNRTISAWVYIDNTAGVVNMFYDETDGTSGYKGCGLYFDSSGYRFELDGNSSYQQFILQSATTKGTWYYLTASFNGTTVKTYMNGVLSNSVAQTVTPTNSTYNSKLGASNYGLYLKGNISQFKVYNTQLSDAEVLTDFNEFKARYGYNPAYGALTNAWVVATGETDTTILGALNTLETDLTTYGLTSKMKALYPFVGGTAEKHKFNFMDARDLDVAFRLTFNGGWVHSSTGALPNGTNAYANTFLIPIADLSLNNNHLSFYSRTQNNLINGVDIGASNAGNINMLDIEISFNNLRYYENNQNLYSNGVNGLLTNGMFVNSRIVNTDFKGYRNGYSEGTISYVSASLTSYPVFLGARNDASVASFYSGKECSLATIGEGLSDTEASNLYTTIQTFQTTLSRQV